MAAADTHRQKAPATRPPLALRFRLSSGVYSVPFARLHHLASFASLSGTPEGYFLGWLRTGLWTVPVFDLDSVLNDQPTPERFSSRVLILSAAADTDAAADTGAAVDTGEYLGLLVGGAIHAIDPAAAEAEPIDLQTLDATLQMLRLLVPEVPA